MTSLEELLAAVPALVELMPRCTCWEDYRVACDEVAVARIECSKCGTPGLICKAHRAFLEESDEASHLGCRTQGPASAVFQITAL